MTPQAGCQARKGPTGFCISLLGYWRGTNMSVLVVDIGGNHVKLLASGQTEPRKVASGPDLTPEAMVAGARAAVKDWEFDKVSLGYPGPIRGGKITLEPHNLGVGWLGYDFEAAFGCEVKLINDAAMQALGGYQGGLMLFLGLGTGLGSALIAEGVVVPLELAHMDYKRSTFEEYVGREALEEVGKKKWRHHVFEVVECLQAAFLPDDILLGGGNVKKLKELPPGCRLGANSHAFLGGFRLWDPEAQEIHLVDSQDSTVD